MITNYINKGDIFLVELNGRGSVINKTRPCIILKAISSIATVIPITSKIKGNRNHLFLKANKNGLIKDSEALFEQITTVDREQLIKPLGRLDDSDVLKLNNKLVEVLC